MNDEKINQLKNEYMSVPIPAELESKIKESLKEGKKAMNKKVYIRRLLATAASAAVITTAITVGINTNEALAETLSDIPVLGGIIKVLTFKEYKFSEKTYDADIETPALDGLENKELQNSLNEKYFNENKELYDQFINDMKSLEENGGGHMGVSSGYIVKTDTDKILSVGRYIENTVGSSSTTFKYDTIDKKNEILVTLPSLFKDESYVDIISSNIKEQMVEQHNEDENKFYWVEGIENESTELFEKISINQSFYISSNGKLIISFDKYEVAPGYMGVVEFEIPTEILENILISSEYIY